MQTEAEQTEAEQPKAVAASGNTTLYDNVNIIPMTTAVTSYAEAMVTQQGRIVYVGDIDRAKAA